MFSFRLSLALGCPHPDFLLAQISSRQLAEWMAYYQVEPWGTPEARLGAAMLASTVANFSPISARHDWKPADFMLQKPKPKTLTQRLADLFGAPLGGPKT